MAGKGGGAWKVAYADFVTAMMAFFLVMWIVAQSQQVKQAVAGYFNDPLAFGDSPTPSGALIPVPTLRPGSPVENDGGGPRRHGRGAGEQAGTLPPDETDDGSARRPSLFVVNDDGRRNAGTLIPFEEQSAELSDKGRDRLTEMVPLLVGKRNKIEIRGHATRRPLPPGSPYADAWQLCYARCHAAMQFLVEQGIDAERFRISQAGVFEPRTTNAEEEWEQQNSRVEVYVLGEFVEMYLGSQRDRETTVQPEAP
jgi:chemotaxis protein MotB